MSGANVFIRLNYNFDSDRFGAGLYLSNSTINFLNNNPVTLTEWQKTELANGSFIRTDYYKNPTTNVVANLWNTVNTIYAVANTIEIFDNAGGGDIANDSVILSNQIYLFSKHTSNISGVTVSVPSFNESTGTNIDYPDYDKVVGLGQELLLVLNETDDLANSVPLLGNFTSLFVNDYIEANTTILISDAQTLNNSIYIEDGNTKSNLTSTQINTIISHIETANTLIAGRREHDWNFYNQSKQILSDYRAIERLTRLGNTQIYLVNNYIGTNNYIQKLTANT